MNLKSFFELLRSSRAGDGNTAPKLPAEVPYVQVRTDVCLVQSTSDVFTQPSSQPAWGHTHSLSQFLTESVPQDLNMEQVDIWTGCVENL